MKKNLMMAAAVAVTAMAVVSCDNNAKADLKDNVDTLAYELGVAQSAELKQYMTMRLNVDSAYIDEFIEGMKEGATAEADAKKNAYAKGVEIGNQVKQMAEGLTREVYGDDSTKHVNAKSILAGLIEGMKGKATMTPDSAYESFNNRLKPIEEANKLKQYGDNKKAGEEYLAKNKEAEGVTTTASGLQYKVIEAGTGALPTDTSVVRVMYEGKLIDGTVFDSSYERNQPFSVNMAMPGVIPGWVEALKLMPAGSKWEVTIPQELAYGSQNQGQIKPFSTLIFTIEVQK